LTTDIFAAQSEFPSFLNYLPEKYGIVPYYGKYNSKDGSEVNYFSWTGDIIFNAGEHIKFSAGRNKFFIGNGYRSLFLSDNSNASPYIKAEINVWKIKYIWTVLKLSDINLSASAVQTYPVKLYDKAAFIHYLSLNITKRINFDFFEAIVTNPYDLDGRRSNYDLTYFNPVIFYRSAEFYEGSSDNSIIGAGLNIRAGKSTFIYSQFILDDLLISSLKDGSGWWGNKFGLQTGIKSYNTLNIKGLFSRFEFNAVRPYTYSHGEAYTTDGIADLNYGSYLQPAAHPSGANFAEGIFEIRYVKKRLSGSLIIILTEKGEDTDSISMGGDIYKSYNLRPSDYGISFLQGEPTDTQIYNLKISYLINPEYNMFFNTGFYYRKEKNDFLVSENSIIYFGITTGIFNSFLD
ncbi:MAG: hypothetical protein GXO50_02045, partial [Chlorobi bacterium]|nr:hypothetical protein [Chlorobiota bacterium]